MKLDRYFDDKRLGVKRFCFVSLITILCFQLAACSDYSLPKLEKSSVILAFGDSLTLGEGVDRVDSYPAVLARLTGVKIINAGVSGETSSEGLQRLPELLEKHEPDLLILLEGGNDILRKVPESAIQQNLATMIELAQLKGIAVLLVGVPEKKLFGDSLDLYSELAEAYQIPVEDDIVASLIKRPSMKSDYVHFTRQGYQALAEAIYKKLQETGAI